MRLGRLSVMGGRIWLGRIGCERHRGPRGSKYGNIEEQNEKRFSCA